MSHRTNLRPGTCAECKAPVAASAGTLLKDGNAWKVVCQACLPFPLPQAATIRIELRGDRDIEVLPVGFLGGERWIAYKAILDRLGARARKEGAVWHTFASLGIAPELCKALGAASFQLEVGPGVQSAIDGLAHAAGKAVAAAEARMVAVDAALARTGKKLYPFQREGVAWIAPREAALLADDMGLGKCIQTLAALPANARVLVISPAVAKGVWAREAKAWRPDLRVTKVDGRGRFRWPVEGEILILNYDILPAVEVDLGEKDDEGKKKLSPAPFLADAPAGLVVVGDEIHAVKNSKALRSQRFKAIAKAARARGGRSWGLSATPLLNKALEMWAVLSALGLANEAFGSFKKFAGLMGGKQESIRDPRDRNQRIDIWKWEGTPSPLVAQILKRVMLRRIKDDVLADLPAKTYKQIDVELDDAELVAQMDAIQEQVAESDWADFLDGRDSPGAKKATFAFSEISSLRARLARAKIAGLVEVVEDYEDAGEPLVVFSAHREPIETLATRPGWAAILGGTPPAERTRIEEAFQAGRLKGVACTIKAGGVAITLTRASNAVFVDEEWTPALNAQAEDRLRRIGQTRPVLISRLVAAHPLDQQVSDLLLAKRRVIDASVERANIQEGESVNAAQVGAVATALIANQADLRAQAERERAARAEALRALQAKWEEEEAAAVAQAEAERLDPKARFERTVARGVTRLIGIGEDTPARAPRTAREIWAAAAIVALADMDADHAQEKNDVGFSRDCTGIGHALARAVAAGLSDAQWDLCVTVSQRFKRQVGDPPPVEG